MTKDQAVAAMGRKILKQADELKRWKLLFLKYAKHKPDCNVMKCSCGLEKEVKGCSV